MRAVMGWGWAMIGAGGALIGVAAGLPRLDPCVREATMHAGTLMGVLGGVLVACSEVRTLVVATNRPADEAYRDGVDVGYERGWRERARMNIRPVAPLIQRRDLSC